jgi:hypothetical protein
VGPVPSSTTTNMSSPALAIQCAHHAHSWPDARNPMLLAAPTILQSYLFHLALFPVLSSCLLPAPLTLTSPKPFPIASRSISPFLLFLYCVLRMVYVRSTQPLALIVTVTVTTCSLSHFLHPRPLSW